MLELKSVLVAPETTIRETMQCIEHSSKKIALVVDQQRHLLGTITDGDIRRAILAGESLDKPVSGLLAQKAESPYPKPVTAPLGTERSVILKLMQERAVRQVPLLDDEGRVAGLVTMDELLPNQVLPLQAVIMAGGFGTRLRPLTEQLPKPMLPVGDRPLMERLIEQLRQAGIHRVNVTTHYLPERITEHFQDGKEFGVEIGYLTEDLPLGTAGALGLVETQGEPLLVINGDILTRIDFRAMLAFHQELDATMTVAVRKYDLNVPYGVTEVDGAYVRRIDEKPLLSFFVNAGIYLLEPEVQKYIPKNERFEMTDLIKRVIDAGKPVVSFPVLEYWLDIGQHGDFAQAQEDVSNGRVNP